LVNPILRNFVDVASNYGSVPNCDISSHMDLAYNRGIRSNKDKALVRRMEVKEVHNVARSIVRLGVFLRCSELLGRKEAFVQSAESEKHY
jgi:hypothetical protein